MGFLYSIVVIILVFVISALSTSAPLPKIEDVSDTVFGPQANGWMLGAVADFNGDKATDLFVISQTRDEIGVILMAPFGYTHLEKLHPSDFVSLVKPIDQLTKIVSVIPGDINNDKNIDFYVVADSNLYAFFCMCNGSINAGKLHGCKPDFVLCKRGKFDLGSTMVDYVFVKDQPMVLDVNGDWQPDVMFINKTDQLDVFTGVDQKCLQTDGMVCMVQRIESSRHFRNLVRETVELPVASLFASFDTEMYPDVLLGRSIYMNEGDMYTLKSNLTWPAGSVKVGLPHICSIENPVNQLEFVLPTCNKLEQKETYYQLCGGGQLKRMVYTGQNNAWRDLQVVLPGDTRDFAWVFPPDDQQIVPADDKQFVPPPAVRSGDFNLDGFVDLVAVVALKEKDSTKFSRPTIVLLRNTVCNETSRCFEMIDVLSGRQPLPGVFPIVATLVDITPDARLAVLATFLNSNGSSPSTHMSAYYVHAEADLSFLKLSISVSDSNTDVKTSANLPGAMVRCQIAQKTSKVALLPRSSHMALGLPYAVFGLGQLPPYVDELSVRLTSRNKSTPNFNHPLIIPNSQLVLIAEKEKPADQWQLQSFLLINWYMFAVLLLLGILTVVSLLLLGGLQIRDKRIEKREKEEEAQHFHFDGM